MALKSSWPFSVLVWVMTILTQTASLALGGASRAWGWWYWGWNLSRRDSECGDGGNGYWAKYSGDVRVKYSIVLFCLWIQWRALRESSPGHLSPQDSPLIGRGWSRDLNTGPWLVKRPLVLDYMTTGKWGLIQMFIWRPGQVKDYSMVM